MQMELGANGNADGATLPLPGPERRSAQGRDRRHFGTTASRRRQARLRRQRFRRSAGTRLPWAPEARAAILSRHHLQLLPVYCGLYGVDIRTGRAERTIFEIVADDYLRRRPETRGIIFPNPNAPPAACCRWPRSSASSPATRIRWSWSTRPISTSVATTSRQPSHWSRNTRTCWSYPVEVALACRPARRLRRRPPRADRRT